jgi:hypothetical protein
MPRDFDHTAHMSSSNKKSREMTKNIAIAGSIFLIAAAIGFFTGAWFPALCFAVIAFPLEKLIEKIYSDKILSARNKLFSVLDKTPPGQQVRAETNFALVSAMMTAMNLHRALSHYPALNYTAPVVGTNRIVLDKFPPVVKPVRTTLSPASAISLSLILMQTYFNWLMQTSLAVHLQFISSQVNREQELCGVETASTTFQRR